MESALIASSTTKKATATFFRCTPASAQTMRSAKTFCIKTDKVICRKQKGVCRNE